MNPIIPPSFQTTKANCKLTRDLFADKNLDTLFYISGGLTFDFLLPTEADCLSLFDKIDNDSLCLNPIVASFFNPFQSKVHLTYNEKVIKKFLCPSALIPQAFKDSAIGQLKSNKHLHCLDYGYSYVCQKLKTKESTLFVNYNHFDLQKIDNVTINFKSFMDFESMTKEISFWFKTIPLFHLKDKIIKIVFDEISSSNLLKPIVKVKGYTFVMNWRNIKSQKIPSLDSMTIFKNND